MWGGGGGGRRYTMSSHLGLMRCLAYLGVSAVLHTKTFRDINFCLQRGWGCC